jgi:hypothetical protein
MGGSIPLGLGDFPGGHDIANPQSADSQENQNASRKVAATREPDGEPDAPKEAGI